MSGMPLGIQLPATEASPLARRGFQTAAPSPSPQFSTLSCVCAVGADVGKGLPLAIAKSSAIAAERSKAVVLPRTGLHEDRFEEIENLPLRHVEREDTTDYGRFSDQNKTVMTDFAVVRGRGRKDEGVEGGGEEQSRLVWDVGRR